MTCESFFCFTLSIDSFKKADQLGRGRPPLPFSENRKECPYFGKKALIVSNFVLNFPFKM